ncbi:MAG TPA: hypothetical protein VFW09_17835 [Solirubrobacteraceae bacterium]|nr:hypothetical protein [Solirubrobacteraceae bacterium]
MRAAHKAAQDATDAITALDAKQQDERKLVTDAEAELHALASADLTDRLDAKRKLDELAAVVSRHVHEQQMRPVVDAQHRAVRALQEFCREHEDEIRAALSPELEAADAEHVKYLASGEKIRQRLQDAHGQFGTLASLVGA